MDPDYLELIEKHQSAVPVKVVSLAKDLGIKVYETEDFADSQSGAIRKENGEFVIYVNSKHPEVRKRFTIAHEIAHFLNDQDYFEDNLEFATDVKQPVQLFRKENEEKAKDRMGSENQKEKADVWQRDVRANKFASELLMPAEKFQEIYEKSSDIEEVASFFNVSVAAASIRASELLKTTII